MAYGFHKDGHSELENQVRTHCVESCRFNKTGEVVWTLTKSVSSLARAIGDLALRTIRRRMKSEFQMYARAKNRTDKCATCERFDHVVKQRAKASRAQTKAPTPNRA